MIAGRYEVLPTAKVLTSTFDPRQAPESQVNDVISHHQTVNPGATKAHIDQIKTNHSDWTSALNDYADHHKYDMVHLAQKHYEPEVIVKNPKALRYAGKHK
jgi:hypothetical protein